MANIMKCSPIQWFLTLAGLSGVAAIFLPFTAYVSPWEAIFDKDFWKLGAPFLLSIFTGILTVRWNISGSISLMEKMFSCVVSILSTCVTMSLFLNMNFPKNIHEVFGLITPIFIFISGGFLITMNYRSGKFKEFSPVMTMQTAYLANGMLCLVAFFEDWQIVAYLRRVGCCVCCSNGLDWLSEEGNCR